MKEQELRVGNYVTLKSKQKIYQIHSAQEITTGCDSDDFEPILLTNPILDTAKNLNKTEFLFNGRSSLEIKGEESRLYLSVSMNLKGNYIADLRNEHGECMELRRVKHLHELQNLVFALSGKEVKIYGI